MTNYSSPVPAGCRPTSGFRTKARPDHAGDDFAPPEPGQTKVKLHAVADGVVQRVGRNILAGHSGLAVLIDHGYMKDKYGNDRMQSYEGHMARYTVKAGDKVKAGDVIGEMGKTGNASGIHVHLGVLCNGAFIDPSEWLARKGVTIGKDKPRVTAAPKSYTVRAGDTLGGIAARHKTTVGQLLKLNPSIQDADLIQVGQRVRLK